MSEPIIQDPLLEHPSPSKQSIKQHHIVSVRSKQSRVMSQLSNVSLEDKHIYDLPDLANVTKRVICRLTAVSIVCIIFLAAEIVGGVLADSLAILSDAAHMFSDMSGFFISIFSIWLGQRPASEKMSFGYHRAEVIGALASIVLIWALTILLLYEATIRIINKSMVTDPLIMLITAGFGLFCNLVMAKVLHSNPTGGHNHGNIMHQCSGHDHGHSHGHSHDHKQKKKKGKKKVFIQQKRSILSENGVSMLIVEQKLESSSSADSQNQFQPIKEESSEHKSDEQGHNHSQMCMHKKPILLVDHNHSANCGHDHEQVEVPIDPNETVEQKKESQIDINEEQQDQQQKQHEECHDEHEHNHDQIDNHQHTHDCDHDHHDQAELRRKELKSSNLSQIGEQDNYNLKAAMIHVIGDILQSIGVLIAALLIYLLGQKYENGVLVFTNWQYTDPICTYLFSVLVLFTTFGVAKECLRVLMEGTPTGLIMEEFAQQLRAIHRVREVHDLHIWSLSVGKPAMSAHIVCVENPEYVLKKATKLCRVFGIYHSTIQIELLDRQGAQDYIKCDHNLHK